jgi:multifunctional 2-oxoglutarate metabolism enzyme
MTPDRTEFGPNAWLIDELYARFLDDPTSVAEHWREFFADYRPTEAPTRKAVAPQVAEGEVPEGAVPLRGIDAVLAKRMDESIAVPIATSVRQVPAKLLEVNRTILNRHLARVRGAKVSFTHLIGFAVARALGAMPGMRVGYLEVNGKPFAVPQEHVHLGLAVDVKREDGTRTLVAPAIHNAESLDFSAFFLAYEDLIKRVKTNKLTADDYAGVTATLTNPGTIGTSQSVPRLMPGQSAIIGVGAIAYPTEFEASDPRTLAEMGIGKIVTLTSTYDHRVIQGAESGEFLQRVHRSLIGEDGFYDEVFEAMRVPYVPVRWRRDVHTDSGLEAGEKQARVLQLINLYRVRGHLIAPVDPLELEPPKMFAELDPWTYGLSIWDLDRTWVSGDLAGRKTETLGEILRILRDAYCRTSTVEYMYIEEPAQKKWIQDRVEGVTGDPTDEERRRILHKLNQAEAFERFLHTKYLGHKRFSLEGAESLIPLLDAILTGAANDGLDEVVMGMAHRGRLNVLANVVGASYGWIFREFEGDIDPSVPQGSGDVKYHLGAVGMHQAPTGTSIRCSVVSNPSHLEAVDPVVEGIVRAKQDDVGRPMSYTVLPLLVHGDAAFAGQGVVAETLNLSQLQGYRTGGTVHVIVNNQLGFTTGTREARSSRYATDVAKMVQAPIFHVNGDDPEACVRVAKLAFAFRQEFNKDVVIDMVCYRRWGHNEADDPALTQPLMYAKIDERRSVRKLYTETLVNRGDLSVEEADAVLAEFQAELQRAFDETKASEGAPGERWKPVEKISHLPPMETGVAREVLDELATTLTSMPSGFTVHPKLKKWVATRATALEKDQVDWAFAESLAFGSLVREGRVVRITGEDTRRGTFSQRHATLVDPTNGDEHTPLQTISDVPGRFLIYDSLLSEFAAVGFEYGYSVARPDALVVWEAQFGDFANGAQVIVDQFLAAAEDKWGQTSRLVLLLPHGYEGQGPEHSSGRIERFLTLAARDNIQVIVPSTPAQYFHALRRQTLRHIAKPAIIFTPKSLLRLPAARSAAADLVQGGFAEVLDDPKQPTDVRRVIFCQGKVVYDLFDRREERSVEGAAIVRIEQPYPFAAEQIATILARYPDADDIVWLQEEPSNMGSWTFLDSAFRARLGISLRVIAREASASPATGSLRIHQREQDALLAQAFDGLKQDAPV